MNFLVRILAALMWLITLLFVLTTAAAQEPEFRGHNVRR
jgi:hypothetical protein